MKLSTFKSIFWQKSVTYITLGVFFLSCARVEVERPEEGMRKARFHDLEEIRESLGKWPSSERDQQLAENIFWLKKRSQKDMQWGQCHLSANELASSFEELLDKSDTEFEKILFGQFDFYEVYGKEKWGEILLTSYYSPVIKGSLRPQGDMTMPLYLKPQDLISTSLSNFEDFEFFDSEQLKKKLVFRIIEDEGKVQKLLPYYSREEIDEKKVLQGKNLEIVYVDPIDAFFFHIQGSGLVELEEGRTLSLGYAAQNGHPYYSIGKSLFDIIPKEEMSKYRLESYLRSLSEEERRKILYENKSYVFFKVLDEGLGRTTFGPEVIEKRTLAVDYHFFPLGSLGLLEYRPPELSHGKDVSGYEHSEGAIERTFVLAHDSGGAIKGPGRADLYWGKGELASLNAGVVRHPAKLWFIVPKACEIEELK